MRGNHHEEYDFSGWATKNDILCDDGRTIRKDAFKGCDGMTVPLVYNHGGRSNPKEIIGHGLLENRDAGVYIYGKLNNTEYGQIVKELIRDGDIRSLSIFANKVKQKAGDVIHGVIREVSVVLSGANPGALIDFVVEHSSDGEKETIDSFYYWIDEADCEFKHGSDVEIPREESDDYEDDIEHAGDKESDETSEGAKDTKDDKAPKRKTVQEILDSLTDEQQAAVLALLEGLMDDDDDDDEESKKPVKHSGDKDDDKEDDDYDVDSNDFENVLDSLTDEQKGAVALLIEQVLSDKSSVTKKKDSGKDSKEEPDEDDEESDNKKKGETEMKHNVFEGENSNTVHGDIRGLFNAAIGDLKRYGSLKDAVFAHASDFGYDDIENTIAHDGTEEAHVPATYGIDYVDYLFPDAQTLTPVPRFIQRDNGWVDKFMNATHKSPFSRVKSVFANITADEARAKGYVKGKRKVDEVFTLLKRTTDPQTIYKKQRMDKDDINDITSFDVVVWMKQEMQLMLREETARAALIGDGRSASSDDKISELHIRPIYTDDDLYSIKGVISLPASATEDDRAKAFIRKAIQMRKDYKGSGNPTLFTTADTLTSMLLLEDGLGRALYATEAELATKLRVKEIIEVPVMENLSRSVNGATHTLAGIIVNPADYNFGADKGGQTSFFEDFDIDYNQQKYLLETRLSGALTVPYSAIVLEYTTTVAAGNGNDAGGEG